MDETGDTTLEEILRIGKAALRAAGLDDPALESRILIEHFTETTRAHAITSPKRPVPAEQVALIMTALERRRKGEPVYRIIGVREFHGLDFALSAATLEPRPDTETLVEEMAPFVRSVADRKKTCRILDLGTGTGAIALALLAEIPEARAVGVDVAEEALVTAKANALALGLESRFETCLSDWFGSVEGCFDAIVSNPPYIRSADIGDLDIEVREHDPLLALDGGPDGLDAYRRIAARAKDHLDAEGRIGLEIGHDQRESVTCIYQNAGYVLVSAKQDLGGNDRVLVFSA